MRVFPQSSLWKHPQIEIKLRLAPSHLTGGLLPDLLVDPRLDPLVLIRGDILSYLTVRGVSAQDVGVEHRHPREEAARDVPQKAFVAPRHGGHEDVK